MERWARRFRRPIVPVPAQAIGHTPPMPVPTPVRQGAQAGRQPEGAIAAVTAGLRLAEQVLFVFVASLWPNAVGGGEPVPIEVMNPVPPPPPLPPRQQEQRQDDDDDSGDEDGPENDGGLREGQERAWGM